LEELIIPEQYLIVLERVYGTVLKLSGNPKWRKSSHFHWAYYNVESERDHAAVVDRKIRSGREPNKILSGPEKVTDWPCRHYPLLHLTTVPATTLLKTQGKIRHTEVRRELA
jgi:hypothetical protein